MASSQRCPRRARHERRTPSKCSPIFSAARRLLLFWLKMGGVLVLTINGARLVAAGRAAGADANADWSRLRSASVASLVLWFTTTLFGAVLPNVL